MTHNSGIGGQAVMEGIMMRNKEKYAIAVRKPDETVIVQVNDYKAGDLEKKFLKIPVLRGVFSFIDSMVTGIKCLMYSATFFDDEEEEDLSALTKEELEAKEKKEKKQEKLFMAGTLILSIALVIGLFMALPYFLMELCSKFISSTMILSLIESVVRVLIFLVYLLLISRMKDIQRTFSYHGAEHKCINCVEHGLPLTVENVMNSSRLHKRCGTSFLFFVVIVSAVFLMFIRAESHVWRIVIRILLIPVVAGVSYEIIRAAGTSDNRCIAALSKPGLAMQKLTTNEPDESMAEVAIQAVEAVFDWRNFLNENFGLDLKPFTAKEVLEETVRVLKENGIPESSADGTLLVEAACGFTRKDAALEPEKPVSDRDYRALRVMIKRRLAGEPVQYITGKADFYGYRFSVTKDVLIPRFDTENLVKTGLELTKEGDKVLDLCTGSGCILISMLKEKQLEGTGSDISEEALKVAGTNAAALGVQANWICSDLFEKVEGKFKVILSNPPYIKSAVIETLVREVKDHEPRLALDGGADGLDIYRRLVKEAKEHLEAEGSLCLEIGADEGAEVRALLEENGYSEITLIRDLNGLDRVLTAKV